MKRARTDQWNALPLTTESGKPELQLKDTPVLICELEWFRDRMENAIPIILIAFVVIISSFGPFPQFDLMVAFFFARSMEEIEQTN